MSFPVRGEHLGGTMKGRISEIQRFSIHDGPGIRTTVFFKGCNLHCPWCHNPESMLSSTELQWYPAKCIGCGRCVGQCPRGAVSAGTEGPMFDRTLCAACGKCAMECYAGARIVVGRDVEASEVMETVLKDRAFYECSSGGVTFSGGEPMLQREFLIRMLALCCREGVHSAVETAGCVPWDWFDGVVDTADIFLYDVKHVDDEAHLRSTGVSAGPILENLERLLSKRARVWVRIPVIPGFNSSVEDMDCIAIKLSQQQGFERLEFMPFHVLGVGKYDSLGRNYTYRDCTPPAPAELERYAALFARRGLAIHGYGGNR